MSSILTSHNFTVIAKDKDRIVGVLQWYVKEDPRAGVAEFEEMHVLEEYIGRRIGSSVLEFAVECVKEYFEDAGIKPRKIFLFVGKSNMTAQRLYEKHGFKLVSEVGNLFSDSEEELFYVLDL